MHIWSNLKRFLYDTDDFMAYFNNRLYLYNFINLKSISQDKIVVCFAKKNLLIKGSKLTPLKCSPKEIILTGNIESVNFYE